MSLSAGVLIWISCRPLIRLAAGVASGFIITKADIFPPVAARGAAQIVFNITGPALLFSKIVPAFTKDNVKVLGPLALVAVLYELIGITLAWIIGQFFWVPHRFRHGLLIAGGWGNVGDLPTAVILSISGSAPFNGTSDQTLAVAYISVFILIFTITLFPCGFHRWLAWDFAGPDVEPEVVQAKIKARRQRIFHFFLLQRCRRPPPPGHNEIPVRDGVDEEKAASPKNPKMVSENRDFVTDDAATIITSPRDSIDPLSRSSQALSSQQEEHHTPTQQPPISTSTSLRQRLLYYARLLRTYAPSVIKGMFNPMSTTVYVALPIALVPKLKALFVEVPGVYMPSAPDGQPPLAVIQDIATFIGNASVPLGLLCLGSSLARLKVPLNQWRKLPVGAIMSLAIARMIIMPVIGVLICQMLIHAGILFKDDKVLVFVCIFLSCLPTGTTQVYLTQMYSATGTAEDVAAFMIPQYIIMFVSMTTLIAYTIQFLF